MVTFLLGIVFFLVATPIGLVTRLVRDPLSRRRDRRATTYWTVPADRPGPAKAVPDSPQDIARRRR